MRPVDPDVQAVLDSGPKDAFGRPRFRLIWGADRLCWVEGFWNGRFERKEVPKYPKIDRWYLEVWQPADFFGSPEMWKERTSVFEGGELFQECGPYPSRGDYVPLTLIEHQVTGEYVHPAPLLIRHILGNCRELSYGDVQKEQNARQDAEDIKLHKDIDNVLGDPFPFGGSTNNVTPKSLITLLKEEEKGGKAHEGYN